MSGSSTVMMVKTRIVMMMVCDGIRKWKKEREREGEEKEG